MFQALLPIILVHHSLYMELHGLHSPPTTEAVLGSEHGAIAPSMEITGELQGTHPHYNTATYSKFTCMQLRRGLKFYYVFSAACS